MRSLLRTQKNGVLAARGAGLDVIVTPSLYSAGEDFSGALAIIETLEAHNISALDFLSARLGI